MNFDPAREAPPSGRAWRDAHLAALLEHVGLGGLERGAVRFVGDDPVVPSRHALGSASAIALAAQALGIGEIWGQRGGRPQRIEINLRRAAYPGLCTFMHLSQQGHPVPSRWNPLARNFFATRDGQRFYLLYSTAYIEHFVRLLAFLDCAPTPEALARAVARWDGEALEDALARHGLMGCVARSPQAWWRHPQGACLAAQGPLRVQRVGDAAPLPWQRAAHRPLEGLRVVDMAHVLAGPLVSRLLAEQGAEVIHVASPHQSDGHLVELDTGFGKRRAFVDLERAGDRERLLRLIDGADVFVQSWRPGALARRGLGPDDLWARQPGLVQVGISCYGIEGPWATRGGYEPLAQTATGFAAAEGSLERPRLACTGTLTDYLTAYLAVTGVVAALLRRGAHGGGYSVDASLAQSAMWIQAMGRLPQSHWPDGHLGVGQLPPLPDDDFAECDSAYGRLRHPRPLVDFAVTPSAWSCPPPPAGSSTLAWADEVADDG